ncbi:hypothetical protein LINPERHAP1_LOCUS11443 [Linum perenne]
MHILRPSTLLDTSFGVIGRFRLSMCIGRVTMSQTSSLVEDTLYLLVSIVLSLAILYYLTGFFMTSSVVLKNV